METLRLSRATHQLVECGVEALEKIGRDHERWADVRTDLGTTILRIDEEIQRLEDRIRELKQAKRALGRAVERIEELRSSTAPVSASTDAPSVPTPAND